MRSKSRFTTLVLLETRESYLQIRVQSLCTLRGHCRQGPRNIRYKAGGTPYSDRSSTGWIAPACLAHSFNHLVGAGEQCRRNLQSDRLGGLEIDYEPELGGHLNRKIARLLTVRDAIDILRRLTQSVLEVVTIADEPAGLDGRGG